MMQRQQAWKIFADAREEATQLLQWLRADRFIGKERREAVEKVRNVLHTACCEFDIDDATTEHEDLSLPLFDALSFVTGILNGASWSRGHDSYRAFIMANVVHALDALDNAAVAVATH